jgi:hypothetical protein
MGQVLPFIGQHESHHALPRALLASLGPGVWLHYWSGSLWRARDGLLARQQRTKS